MRKPEAPKLPPRSALRVVPPDIAKLDRPALEQRLAAAESRLDAALPLEEAFDLKPLSSASDARVRPVFDRVFQTKPGESPLYTLECHETVCRLETDVSMNDWQEALMDEGPELFSSMQVGLHVSYMRLEDPGRAAGIRYSINVITDFLDGPATKECKQRNPARGVAEFALHLDTASRKVLATASGTLANEAVGVCLRRVLEDIVDRTPVPPEMTAVVEGSFPVSVP